MEVSNHFQTLNMSKFDLSMHGVTAGVSRFRHAASVTRGFTGEPVQYLNPGRGSGTTDLNEITICADSDPVIATDEFVGILASVMLAADGTEAGTIAAGYVNVGVPIPNASRIRGKAETAGSVDTQTELTGLINDYVAFGLSGSAFTIQTGGEAEAAGLRIVDGNFSRGTLDVVVAPGAMREAIA